MSRRFYICDVIGDGQDVDPTPLTGPYRPAISDLGVSVSGSIVLDPVTNKPAKNWVLALVNTNNHARVISMPGVDPLPDFPLDGKVSAVNTATRDKMLTALARRGIDGSFIQGADGYREVIRGIGRQCNPAFDENNIESV